MSPTAKSPGGSATRRIDPIVVGVDGSADSRTALDWAIQEAALRRRPLCIVHAFLWPLSTVPFLTPHPEVGLRQSADALLTEAEAYVGERSPQLQVQPELAIGTVASALIERSREADLMVLGHHGRSGLAGLLLGSTGVLVSAHARCPVVIVPAAESWDKSGQNADSPPRPSAGRVVVGVDGSPESEVALGFALEEATLRHTGLTAVLAWAAPKIDERVPPVYDVEAVSAEQTRLLTETLAGWRDRYPNVDVRERVLPYSPTKALAVEAHGAELLVVGSRGHGGFTSMLLGSVSQAVLQYATCPVALIRRVHARHA